MTRSEVAELYRNTAVGNGVNGTIEFFIKAGMLKVEEEKTVEEKVMEAWKNYGTCGVANDYGSRSLIRLLDKAGLKIVEKDK